MNGKIQVTVDYTKDTDGNIIPHLILWVDGRKFQIERILHACILEEDDIIGIRYTILIYGKQKKLYYLSDNKWYVEAA